MRHTKRAFTLVELIVIIAILSLLCAILFPVFNAARGSADRATCIGNLRNLGIGTHVYLTDYDDRLMPVNMDPAAAASSKTDRTWVQILLPYVSSFALFRCPADRTNRPRPEATFDQDLVPGDIDSQYYSASMRSDYGYNFQNLAPIVMEGRAWVAEPKMMTQVVDPETTLLFVESTWARNESGDPTGGGNWLVTPPCRYYADTQMDSFTGRLSTNVPVYTTAYGWNVQGARIGASSGSYRADQILSPAPPELYGSAWPRHNGKMNVSLLEGSVRNITPEQLGQGCTVKDAWQGKIFDRRQYLWDVN